MLKWTVEYLAHSRFLTHSVWLTCGHGVEGSQNLRADLQQVFRAEWLPNYYYLCGSYLIAFSHLTGIIEYVCAGSLLSQPFFFFTSHNLLIWSIMESTRNGQHCVASFSHSPLVLWLGLSKLTCMVWPQRGCIEKTGYEPNLLLSVTQQILAWMFLNHSALSVELLRVEQNLPLSESVGGVWKNHEKGPRGRMAFVQGHRASWCQSCRLHQGFSTSTQLTFWFRPFFVAKGCPVHCRMARRVPGLCLPNAGSILLLICDSKKKKKNASRCCQMSPAGWSCLH